MPASTYRHSGKHIPVATASATLTAGNIAYQEGFVGVVITGVASGKPTELDVDGVHNLVVPSGTVKGDKLYADLFAGESASLSLTKTATNNTLVGIALSDRGSDTKALVLLRHQPYTEVEGA